MKSTTTKTPGWQKQCWDWAKAKEPFELRDAAKEHLVFCDELCAAYGGQYQFSPITAVATFTFWAQSVT